MRQRRQRMDKNKTDIKFGWNSWLHFSRCVNHDLAAHLLSGNVRLYSSESFITCKPQHPSISIHILYTVLFTIPEVLTGRLFVDDVKLMIISFILLSIMYNRGGWYWKKKVDDSHSWGSQKVTIETPLYNHWHTFVFFFFLFFVLSSSSSSSEPGSDSEESYGFLRDVVA